MNIQNRIVNNARRGEGACKGCPAQLDTQGRFVNPGLINPDSDLMFLTMDPSHHIDWESYGDWEQYNEEKSQLFKSKWPGGKAIAKILSEIPDVTLDDIWLADAVKCPVNNDRAGDVNSEESFNHCKHYLREEIRSIDPSVIVTMGNDPAEQLLKGVYRRGVGSIKAGTQHCGQVFDTSPPIVISPHWANGWLGRHNNREKVRRAILDVY